MRSGTHHCGNIALARRLLLYLNAVVGRLDVQLFAVLRVDRFPHRLGNIPVAHRLGDRNRGKRFSRFPARAGNHQFHLFARHLEHIAYFQPACKRNVVGRDALAVRLARLRGNIRNAAGKRACAARLRRIGRRHAQAFHLTGRNVDVVLAHAAVVIRKCKLAFVCRYCIVVPADLDALAFICRRNLCREVGRRIAACIQCCRKLRPANVHAERIARHRVGKRHIAQIQHKLRRAAFRRRGSIHRNTGSHRRGARLLHCGCRKPYRSGCPQAACSGQRSIGQ